MQLKRGDSFAFQSPDPPDLSLATTSRGQPFASALGLGAGVHSPTSRTRSS